MRAINDQEASEFEALTNGEQGFALVSTEFDGEETVAIVSLIPGEDGETVQMVPRYVAVTDSMFDRLTNPEAGI